MCSLMFSLQLFIRNTAVHWPDGRWMSHELDIAKGTRWSFECKATEVTEVEHVIIRWSE